MFGSQILEVAIGVVFIYMLVAIICSAVRESIESWLKSRAVYLERGIREMLHDSQGKGLARTIYEHPLIYSLYAGKYKPTAYRKKPPKFLRGHSLPTYIPTSNFALALLDIAARGPDPLLASDGSAPVLSLENVRNGVTELRNEPVQRVLLTAIDTAHGDLDRAKKSIEDWYDSAMDRVSGWYKRSTQWWLLWIGLFTAIALNINTITIADYLYRNDAARAAIVARAQAATKDSTAAKRPYDEARAALDSLDLPIGWQKGWGAPRPKSKITAGLFVSDPWNNIGGPLLGWLLTAFAATLGAPFWFDLLNKMMVIRSTVKPKEKSPEEGSEDRQPKVAKTTAKPEAPPVAPTPAPAPAAPAPVASATVAPHIADGCDVPITRITRDEDLPPAEGGVA